MTTEQLLSELRTLDIQLSVEGDRLRCSAPRGRLSGDLEQRIAAHKPELIRALLSHDADGTKIPARPNKAYSPLSFAQERFWFLQSFDPGTSAYNLTASYRFVAPVDVAALQLAIHATIERHEILRTTFPEINGSPGQVVLDADTVKLTLHDFNEFDPEGKQTAISSVLQETSQQPFDLGAGPPLRLAWIRSSIAESLLVLTVHHILCDAWSVGIFFSEVQRLYSVFARGDASSLPPLRIQYSDYAAWERERLAVGALKTDLEYWKAKLAGAPRHIELPLDRERSTTAEYEGRLVQFQLDRKTSQALKDLGRREGATPFMVLVAALKVLLFRYTRQPDIVVGTPISTRTASELEKMIGCFINTQVLRTEIPVHGTAKDLVRKVRSTVLESLDRDRVPFEVLLSELKVERNLKRSPLFQVALILQNTPMASDYDMISGGTSLDMTMYVWEWQGVFAGSIEYNARLFDPETIGCLTGCFQTVIGGMTEAPDTPLEAIPLMLPSQQAAWFAAFSGPDIAIPEFCAHEWFERQAVKTPKATAVTCGRESLSYEELDIRSNRLAHQLRALGVRKETLVGLCLSRTADIVTVPLAVWKAGGAYVPLDPDLPRERLAFMLQDSAVAVLVTESELLGQIPESAARVICLDRDEAQLKRQNSDSPGVIVSGQNLAYVLYTSGSTGKPKGVEVTHRALVNFLASMQQEPGLSPSDRLLAVTTISFDIAGLELYLPLVTGAQVVIAPRAATPDGAALVRLLEDHAITVMQATPVTWRLLLEAGWHGKPGFKILCGGEALPRDLANRLISAGADAWNLYGPTETTIWSTIEHLAPGPEPVSIGRPIANTRVHLLDEDGRVVPPGVPGELCIAGEGLARGYRKREGLTAERFVDRGLSGRQERLYRTGDRARRLPGGKLGYLGRGDSQVKLRGYRIELGEIEAVLQQQPGISEAVAILREDSGESWLAAYVKTEDGMPADVRILREGLLRSLPEYMVPSAILQVAEFPLTPNRKVDRQQLRGAEYDPRRNGSGGVRSADDAAQDLSDSDFYQGPTTHVQAVMLQIWRDVLGLERVGVHDNFFELGGHSLSAVRLIAHLRAELGMELPLRCIFVDPTIKGLSRHIAYVPSAHGYVYTTEIPKWNCLVPAQPKGSRTPLFIIAGYQSADDTLLVLSQLIQHLGTDQPVFGFRPRWVHGGADYSSVEELAREFIAEMRTVQATGPYLLVGHCAGGIGALEMARLLLKEGEKVSLMMLVDTERPSAARTFFRELFANMARARHIRSVIAGIVQGRDGSRIQMVRNLIRHKLGTAAAEQPHETSKYFWTKIRYRRLLYSHNPGPYSGKITLVVNEEQNRADKNLGWAGYAGGGLMSHVVPGNHGALLSQHGKEVADVILKSIADLQQGESLQTPAMMTTGSEASLCEHEVEAR